MAYLRLDTSNPALNPKWRFPPAISQEVLRCAAGAAVTRQHVLDQLRAFESRLASLHPGQRWIGFFSYELGRWLEDESAIAPADGTPLYALARCTGDPANPAGPQAPSVVAAQHKSPLKSNFSREQYLAAVATCKRYIAAGDIYQANLSQRFSTELPEDPLAIYHRLLAKNPATYGAFLNFADICLICNSPELFLRVEPLPDGRRRVITRPIKGTRPRGADREAELRDSVKDQAELNMIIDLERNDLGRVCEIGSVRVSEPRTIEAHPTVYHGVATVEGILRRDVTFVDLLRATFPGGSITGAPKIRAMQIIDELETVPRGPYCGAIGHFDSDGTIELNIAIRTMIVIDGVIHIHVGGGIVADSEPQAEYEETLVKAQAMFAALGVSSRRARPDENGADAECDRAM